MSYDAVYADGAVQVDFDRDGDLDVLLFGVSSAGDRRKLLLLENTPPTGPGMRPTFSLRSLATWQGSRYESPSSRSPVLLDFDRDGLLDVLVDKGWARGNADGSLSYRLDFPPAKKLIALDLDGDGPPEVVDARGNWAWKWIANPPGSISTLPLPLSSAGASAATAAMSLPPYGLGYHAVLGTTGTDAKLVFRYPDARRTGAMREVLLARGFPAYADILQDMDGDGDIDGVYDHDTKRVSLALNQGSGEPCTIVEVTRAALYAKLDTADIDGDGLLDIIAATNDGKIAWYDAGSSWTEHNLTTVEDNFVASELLVRDFDGNGTPDLLAFEYPCYRFYFNERVVPAASPAQPAGGSPSHGR